MTGQGNARAFLDAVRGYVDPKGGAAYTPSASRPNRLATVTDADTGTGPGVALLFDGETIPAVKLYPWATDARPVEDDRVVLIPVGRSYVIVGILGT